MTSCAVKNSTPHSCLFKDFPGMPRERGFIPGLRTKGEGVQTVHYEHWRCWPQPIAQWRPDGARVPIVDGTQYRERVGRNAWLRVLPGLGHRPRMDRHLKTPATSGYITATNRDLGRCLWRAINGGHYARVRHRGIGRCRRRARLPVLGQPAQHGFQGARHRD